MACLASRIPYGEAITEKKLEMVEAAEAYLANNDFKQYRVRHHGTVARIEIERSEMEKINEPILRENIVEKFKEIGFLHVAVDLEGYTAGSMNRALEIED